MKTVIITNTGYKDRVFKLLTDAVDKMNDGRKSKTVLTSRKAAKDEGESIELDNNENLKVIDSRKEYVSFNFVQFFNQDFAQSQVFITPELFWEDWDDYDSPVDEGYEIAYDLLNNKLEGKRFYLHFVSIYNQEQLLKMTTPFHSMMVESFPHHWLLDENVADALSFRPYSETHFELIKNIAISKTGIVDKLLHDLGHLDDGNDLVVFKERASRLLRMLAVFDQVAPDAEALADQLEELEDLEDSAPWVGQLRALVNSVKTPENKDVVYGYNVLVIEDDPSDRRQLCEFFKKHFKTVICNDEKNLKLSEAPKWLLNEAKSCHLVVLDLFYQDERHCWLPFSGLDLYKLLCNNQKELTCAVRVVTGLPRNEVSKVVEKTHPFKIPVEHLYSKADGIQHAIGWMEGRLMDIIKDCDEIARKKAEIAQGPKNGALFVIGSQYVQALRETDAQDGQSNKEFNRIFNMVVNQVETAARGGERWDRTLGKKESEEEIARTGDDRFPVRLTNLLRMRVFVLKCCAENGTTINTDHFRDKLNKVSYGSGSIDKMRLDGAFFNRLGFSCKAKYENTEAKEIPCFYVEITEDQLYPEEWIYWNSLTNTYTEMGLFTDGSDVLGWLESIIDAFQQSNNKQGFLEQIKDHNVVLLDLIDRVLNVYDPTLIYVADFVRLLKLLKQYRIPEDNEEDEDYIETVFQFDKTDLYSSYYGVARKQLKELYPEVLAAYQETFPQD